MIKVKGLNKYYNKGKNNEIHVISDTSFELPETGLITFLGESGSGKTTLLNVIGGLDKATGRIEYDDLEIKNYKMSKIDKYRRNNIGYIFQNYNIIPDITVYDNLRIALEIIGVTDPEEVDKRIQYALTAVNMYKFRKKYAYALSGGQQQRVSIARALIKDSKIIIADEPTGNLDSKNTVEVMNILKKISKKSLVLLVTHEKKICDFYSDIVFTVCDGKITGRIEQAGNGATLMDEDQNKIYKGDLEYKQIENELGSIELYSNEEITNLDVKLYVKNGTIYLDANKPIKLLAQSGVTVVDGKNEVLTNSVDVAEDFEYNPEFNKGKKRGFWKIFKRSLATAWARLAPGRRRTKVIYAVLIALGAQFALSSIFYMNVSRTLYSRDSYNENIYRICTDNDDYEHEPNNAIIELYTKQIVTNFAIVSTKSFEFSKQISPTFSIEDTAYLTYTLYNSKCVNIAYGTAPKADNEIIISKNVAEDIISNSGGIIDLETFLGTEVKEYYYSANNDGGKYKVVGLSDDSDMLYLTENAFYLNYYYASYGSDWVSYIPDNYYSLISGRTPNANNEIVMPNTEYNADTDLPYQIGDTYRDYTVVGIYDAESKNSIKAAIVTKSECLNLIFSETFSKESTFFFFKDDVANVNNYLKENDYHVRAISTKALSENELQNRFVYLVFCIVLAAVAALFIYFTMRSKMISDVYTIGVYRSLGMARRKIIGQFALETFLVCTFTSIIGYFIGYFLYIGIASLVNEVLNSSILVNNIGLIFAGAGILYVIVVTFGVLPILMLLKNTPKEICNKYDI